MQQEDGWGMKTCLKERSEEKPDIKKHEQHQRSVNSLCVRHPIISCTCSQRPRLHSALTSGPSAPIKSGQPKPGLLLKSSINMSPKCQHPSLSTSAGGYQAKEALWHLVHVLTFLNVPSDESISGFRTTKWGLRNQMIDLYFKTEHLSELHCNLNMNVRK